MLKPITLLLMAMTCFCGTAFAQGAAPAPPVPVYLSPPQQPVITSQPPPVQQPVVAAPFGGLYNTLSGTQPPAPGQQAPLTPFNARR
jgi:hypothetical protein